MDFNKLEQEVLDSVKHAECEIGEGDITLTPRQLALLVYRETCYAKLDMLEAQKEISLKNIKRSSESADSDGNYERGFRDAQRLRINGIEELTRRYEALVYIAQNLIEKELEKSKGSSDNNPSSRTTAETGAA